MLDDKATNLLVGGEDDGEKEGKEKKVDGHLEGHHEEETDNVDEPIEGLEVQVAQQNSHHGASEQCGVPCEVVR